MFEKRSARNGHTHVARAHWPAGGPGHRPLQDGQALELEISDTGFVCRRRKSTQIHEEAALDGLYLIHTSLPVEEALDAEVTVRTYKGLSRVERAFRSMKSINLKVRPIHHHRAGRVRTCCCACSPTTWRYQRGQEYFDVWYGGERRSR